MSYTITCKQCEGVGSFPRFTRQVCNFCNGKRGFDVASIRRKELELFVHCRRSIEIAVCSEDGLHEYDRDRTLKWIEYLELSCPFTMSVLWFDIKKAIKFSIPEDGNEPNGEEYLKLAQSIDDYLVDCACTGWKGPL